MESVRGSPPPIYKRTNLGPVYIFEWLNMPTYTSVYMHTNTNDWTPGLNMPTYTSVQLHIFVKVVKKLIHNLLGLSNSLQDLCIQSFVYFSSNPPWPCYSRTVEIKTYIVATPPMCIHCAIVDDLAAILVVPSPYIFAMKQKVNKW